MTFWRTLLLLSGSLVVLVLVVMLRAETTRLRHSTVQVNGESMALWRDLRVHQLDLARFRNPMLNREDASSSEDASDRLVHSRGTESD